MDASESARMRRLDGGRGREERCDIPVGASSGDWRSPCGHFYGCERKNYLISYFVLIWISDLHISACCDAWTDFWDHVPFWRLAGELGVLLWFTYETEETDIHINTNNFKLFLYCTYRSKGE